MTRTSGLRQLCPALCTRPDTISSACMSRSAGDQGPGTMIMGVTEPSSAVTSLLHGGMLPGTWAQGGELQLAAAVRLLFGLSGLGAGMEQHADTRVLRHGQACCQAPGSASQYPQFPHATCNLPATAC